MGIITIRVFDESNILIFTGNWNLVPREGDFIVDRIITKVVWNEYGTEVSIHTRY